MTTKTTSRRASTSTSASRSSAAPPKGRALMARIYQLKGLSPSRVMDAHGGARNNKYGFANQAMGRSALVCA